MASEIWKGRWFAAMGLWLLAATVASANEAEVAEAKAPVEPPWRVETRHQGQFGGQTLRYTARVGEMQLVDAAGKPAAALCYTAYLVDGDRPRPVSFVFNGGPGSASVWLHMGLLGPQRVVLASEADADDGAAPYRLAANPLAPLDLTDLVFVDPIGTGYSRVIGGGRNEDYWSMRGDTASIAQFVRRFVTEEQRWNAPKYLIGESFGTTRAAAVADALMGDGQDLALNGLVLISQALDYTGSTPAPDNLIAHVTYLPTLAATARYHGRAGTDQALTEWLAAARRFAIDDYLPALFRGAALRPADRQRVAEGLSGFIGLPTDYILRADLRVLAPRYVKELLRDQGLTVGRLDSRYLADESDDTAAEEELGDAASNAISSAFTAALNSYLATSLDVHRNQPYLTDNDDLGEHWDYRLTPPGEYWEPLYVNTARSLTSAMRRNSQLRVMVANGYYDLVTPFFDAEYTFGRHGIPTDRVQMRYYEAGHMMYLRQADFEALLRDIRQFYRAAILATDGLQVAEFGSGPRG
ncbi:MAG: peptidase S10 [Lysobacterales bacterium]